jgi:hypothetical protein
MVIVHLKSGEVVRVERATSVTVEEDVLGTLMTPTAAGGGERQACVRCRAPDGSVVEEFPLADVDHYEENPETPPVG